MGVIAMRNLNVFGRKIAPGEHLTAAEIAKWDSGKHQVSFQSHLNMGWIEKTEAEAPKGKPLQVKPTKGYRPKAGTEIHTKTTNAKGTPKPKAKPPVSQVA